MDVSGEDASGEGAPPEGGPITSQQICCRLPPGLYRKLTQLAAADQRTLPGMIRRLIAQARLEVG